MRRSGPTKLLTAMTAGLALIAGAALTACRSKPPADIPGEFTFRGTAIHPAAINALYKDPARPIDLAAFKTGLEALQWEDQPGWWVTEFEEDPATGRSPFFAYAAFAGPVTEEAELYVVSVTFNQGEPADVDNIMLLQKSGRWLGAVRLWAEGSACDGAISNQRLENETFFYSRELTPVDLLGLAAGPPPEVAANEDLEATSESCFAQANYAYSLAEDREDLLSVRLYEEAGADEKGRTERYRRQTCFNRIFNDYVARGKTALTPKEVDEFAARFKDECLKPAAPAPAPPPAEK